MNASTSRSSDRIAELQIEELEGGLDPSRERELAALLASAAAEGWHRESAEFSLAAIHVAVALGATEAMPEPLREQILGGAPSAFAPALAAPQPVPQFEARATGWIGWAVAAAAAAVALVGWLRSPEPVAPSPPLAEAPRPLTPEDRLAAMLTSRSLVRVEAAGTQDPYLTKPVSGEFVWHPGRQEGFMVFEGLRPNDPNQHQYQLWIFDAARTDEHPVDGGVFDIDAEGKAVIPIDAKLAVARPTLFAVTLESPGGVVVSDREHILVVGKPEAL